MANHHPHPPDNAPEIIDPFAPMIREMPPSAPASMPNEESLTRKQRERRSRVLRIVGLLFVAAAIAMSGVVRQGRSWSSLLLAMSMPIAAGIIAWGAALSDRLSVLQRRSSIATAIAMMLTTAWWWHHQEHSQAIAAMFACGALIVAMAVAPIALGLLVVRHAFAMAAALRTGGMMFGIVVAVAGVYALHCPNQNGWHVAIGHGAPALTVLGLGWIAARITRA